MRQVSIPLVIVSHDREFLDQVCNKIVDIEDGNAITYSGNYSKFVATRKVRINAWRDKYDKQTKYIQEEEKWIKKAKSDPALSHQVKARSAALEKYRSSSEFLSPPPKQKKFKFRFPATGRCGESVLEGINVGHGYGEGKHKVLFENVNFEVTRGNRIGFIGPNGSGML